MDGAKYKATFLKKLAQGFPNPKILPEGAYSNEYLCNTFGEIMFFYLLTLLLPNPKDETVSRAMVRLDLSRSADRFRALSTTEQVQLREQVIKQHEEMWSQIDLSK